MTNRLNLYSKNNNLNTILTSILLIVGVYLPSSINSKIMPTALLALNYGIILSILIYFFTKYRVNDLKLYYMFIFINISLIYSTIASKIVYNYPITIGAYLPYLVLSLMYLIDLKKLEVEDWIENVFNIINIINIVICLFLIIGNDVVQKFIYNLYLNFYPKILEYMFYDNKPVLTFVSHSIASLYMFLFFFLNYISYKSIKKKMNFIFIISYMIILFFMKSNTGYVFLSISILIILFDNLDRIKKYSNIVKNALQKNKMVVILSIILISLGIILLLNTPMFKGYIEQMKIALGSEFNGFRGRFGSDLFVEDIEYIKNNILLPVGVTYNKELYYTDNGFIVTMLRGGILLIIGLYYGLYTFLKENIIDKKCRNYIFLAFIIFEIAYTNLEFSRTLYLLPFVVIYLNYLNNQSKNHYR